MVTILLLRLVSLTAHLAIFNHPLLPMDGKSHVVHGAHDHSDGCATTPQSGFSAQSPVVLGHDADFCYYETFLVEQSKARGNASADAVSPILKRVAQLPRQLALLSPASLTLFNAPKHSPPDEVLI